MFGNPLYQVDIFENITTGTAILQLSAQDSDLDVNTGLQYSIVSGNSLERFFIDAFSGVLYVKSPIDRDPPNNETSFLLTVINFRIPCVADGISRQPVSSWNFVGLRKLNDYSWPQSYMKSNVLHIGGHITGIDFAVLVTSTIQI